MKVKELIELLLKEDQKREVVIQKDSEGNEYSPFCGLWTGHYVPTTTWYGEAFLDELTEEDTERGFCEEDLTDDDLRQKALFLVPIN